MHTELNDASVKMLLTVQGLQEHQQLLRVVWLEPAGTVRKPKHAGMQIHDGDKRTLIARVRDANCQAHIYADTLDNLETLLNKLIAAFEVKFPNITIQNYSFPQQEDKLKDGRIMRTQKCVLRFVLPINVPSTQQTLTPLTGETHTCSISVDL